MVAYRDVRWPIIQHRGHIAGEGAGIVTVDGRPAARVVCLFERNLGMGALRLVAKQVSLPDGSYRFTGLNPKQAYVVMAIDEYKQYEPVAWDWVYPALDD